MELNKILLIWFICACVLAVLFVMLLFVPVFNIIGLPFFMFVNIIIHGSFFIAVAVAFFKSKGA